MKSPVPMLIGAGLVTFLSAVVLVTAACTHADGQPGGGQSSYGTVSGRVTRGPMFPVSGPGMPTPPAAPVAGVELRFVDAKGALVATARTDAAGLFHVAISPGEYRIERGTGFTGATKNLPSLVSVSPGNETRFDIIADTGIR